jgi:hypothetical protein
VEGFALATTLEGGVLHEHLDLVVLGGGSTAPGTSDTPPTRGIYGVALSFVMDAFQDSQPAFLFMQHGDVDGVQCSLSFLLAFPGEGQQKTGAARTEGMKGSRRIMTALRCCGRSASAHRQHRFA